MRLECGLSGSRWSKRGPNRGGVAEEVSDGMGLGLEVVGVASLTELRYGWYGCARCVDAVRVTPPWVESSGTADVDAFVVPSATFICAFLLESP